MKNMSRLLALLLAAALMFSGCGGKEKGPDTPKEPAPETHLDVPLRYSGEGGTLLEMPQIVGDDNAAIRTINGEMEGWYNDLVEYYADDSDYWGELLAYPTENDRFLNAVVTFCEYPIYGTNGEVYSWVYNKNTKQRYTLENAFDEAGTDAETLLADFTDWYAADGQEVLGIDTLAFRMLEDGTPQFLAGVIVVDPYVGDSWTSFHTWTDGSISWLGPDPVDPNEVTGTFTGGPLYCQNGGISVDPEETGDVWLNHTTYSEGDWPFALRLETLEFCGVLNEELEQANESLWIEAENQRKRFDDCVALGEAGCYEDGAFWADLWAYPVSTDRYLSAVTVQQTNMHFRVEGATQTWNMVSSIVYDKEEQRIVSLEGALAMAGIDEGMLEQDVAAYVKAQNLGTYENWSSLDFYMAEDGEPVFMIGAVVDIPWGRLPWTSFFTWDGGEIAWPHDHPMPLNAVDTDQGDLACLAGMGQYEDTDPGQYDGAAMISEEEAFDVLDDIYDVQNYLTQGMSMVSYGTTEYLDGEAHLLIEVGFDYGNDFDTEFIYAVSWGSVYQLDFMTGEWSPVGFG